VTIGELPKELAVASAGPRRKTAETMRCGGHGRAMPRIVAVVAEAWQESACWSNRSSPTARVRAGLRPGDIIREINRKPVRSSRILSV